MQKIYFIWKAGIYILAIPPPPGGGIIVYIENREEFEGGHEKRKGKGGIDKKNTLKYLYEV